jgi:hypothetical protein
MTSPFFVYGAETPLFSTIKVQIGKPLSGLFSVLYDLIFSE